MSWYSTQAKATAVWVGIWTNQISSGEKTKTKEKMSQQLQEKKVWNRKMNFVDVVNKMRRLLLKALKCMTLENCGLGKQQFCWFWGCFWRFGSIGTEICSWSSFFFFFQSTVLNSAIDEILFGFSKFTGKAKELRFVNCATSKLWDLHSRR